MGALDRSNYLRDHPRAPRSSTAGSVYEPILLGRSSSSSMSQTPLPRFYSGGFEHQKRRWASIDRRSHRIRYIAWAQLLLGLVASWNYLWVSNAFSCFVGIVGLVAYRSDRLSWTLMYLLVCTMEFARNALLASHLYDRFSIPQYHFTPYECVQVGVLVVQEVFLVPASFWVVFAAAASAANPRW